MSPAEIEERAAAADAAEVEAAELIERLQIEISRQQFIRARQSERARVYRELLDDDHSPTDQGDNS